MGFINKLKDFIFEDIVEEPTEVNVIADDYVNLYSHIWQQEYAIQVVINFLSACLINSVWRTYKSKKQIKDQEYYRLNYAINNRESAQEFYGKLANKLIRQREALIVELNTNEFFVADSYQFINGNMNAIKPNTFIDVTVDTVTLKKHFKENENCIYIRLPYKKGIEELYANIKDDYTSLKDLVNKGAKKALGMKLNLQLNATGKNKYDDAFFKNVEEKLRNLMEKDNSVFLTYTGEQLKDLTETQRGSEVEQVIKAVENNIKINDEILTTVGNLWGISKSIMKGEITTDNADSLTMTMTVFAKPILKLISNKFTIYLCEKEDIISGSRIEIDIDTVKFIDILSMANAVDKLIGSSFYTVNELKEKINEESVANGDVRYITKNYQGVSTDGKGESG